MFKSKNEELSNTSFIASVRRSYLQLLFKAIGGLFMGVVLMRDKKDSISEKDIEGLLNQLITDPTEK